MFPLWSLCLLFWFKHRKVTLIPGGHNALRIGLTRVTMGLRRKPRECDNTANDQRDAEAESVSHGWNERRQRESQDVSRFYWSRVVVAADSLEPKIPFGC